VLAIFSIATRNWTPLFYAAGTPQTAHLAHNSFLPRFYRQVQQVENFPQQAVGRRDLDNQDCEPNGYNPVSKVHHRSPIVGSWLFTTTG
jgi:hypothetical protein